MYSFMSTILIAIVAVAFIVLSAKWLAKESSNKALVGVVSPALESMTTALQGLVNITNPELSSKFSILSEIANAAVNAVEQMSTKESITSEEKLETALSFYNTLIKVSGIETTDLDTKSAEILIENAVYRLNSDKTSATDVTIE